MTLSPLGWLKGPRLDEDGGAAWIMWTLFCICSRGGGLFLRGRETGGMRDLQE